MLFITCFYQCIFIRERGRGRGNRRRNRNKNRNGGRREELGTFDGEDEEEDLDYPENIDVDRCELSMTPSGQSLKTYFQPKFIKTRSMSID